MKKMNHITSKQKFCYVCKIEFSTDNSDKKITIKSEITVVTLEKDRGTAYVCNPRFKTPIQIPAVFHNGSNSDYHFIMKELVEEFKGQFQCRKQNTGKYIAFSVLINKELENDKTFTYTIKFIGSFGFI